jgi:hypothetical protein
MPTRKKAPRRLAGRGTENRGGGNDAGKRANIDCTLKVHRLRGNIALKERRHLVHETVLSLLFDFRDHQLVVLGRLNPKTPLCAAPPEHSVP